jgi:hypothetical protein
MIFSWSALSRMDATLFPAGLTLFLQPPAIMTVFPNGPFGRTEESKEPERLDLRFAPERLCYRFYGSLAANTFDILYTARTASSRLYGLSHLR